MLRAIGHRFFKMLQQSLYALGFFFQVLRESLFFLRRQKVAFKVLTMQIYFTGVKALGIITLIALAIGAAILINGIAVLPQFGQGNLVYLILITVITRELGPVLTAFIVIARSATAIATELGDMVVTHQIEAYVSIGINPVSYLVVPRFLGVTISTILLTIYFNFIGLFAAFFLTQVIKPIPFFDYFYNLFNALKVVDVITMIMKSLVFGIIISITASYYALKVQVASTEIPVAVIKAVGQGFVLCIIADVIITLVYYI
ncbi:MAG: ABC transporter permease [Spirochaetales bacterium]|nr:ABC transporter permease [Spirochaetales bacterium]